MLGAAAAPSAMAVEAANETVTPKVSNICQKMNGAPTAAIWKVTFWLVTPLIRSLLGTTRGSIAGLADPPSSPTMPETPGRREDVPGHKPVQRGQHRERQQHGERDALRQGHQLLAVDAVGQCAAVQGDGHLYQVHRPEEPKLRRGPSLLVEPLRADQSGQRVADHHRHSACQQDVEVAVAEDGPGPVAMPGLLRRLAGWHQRVLAHRMGRRYRCGAVNVRMRRAFSTMMVWTCESVTPSVFRPGMNRSSRKE